MSRRLTANALAVLALAVLVLAPVATAEVRPADRVAGVRIDSAGQAGEAAPDLEMASGYLGTVDGRELWSRDADDRRPMASTTKIMSAVVILGSDVGLDESVEISPDAAKVGQARYNLRAGEVRTVRQLLEEMLVKSGNDAAAALAEHVAGSEAAFVESMNDKAAELGLRDTHYENPHGLDEDGHYTSARDLAALTRHAMCDPEFRRIVGLRWVTVVTGGRERRMENTNVLLGELEGVVGVKTGMTDDAGWCLVGQAERGEVGLLSVVLGARGGERGRAAESRRLLEWGFEHYRSTRLASRGETMGVVPVSDYLDVSVPAVVAETTAALVFDLDGAIRRTVDLMPSVEAPVLEGDRLGTLSVYQGERLLRQLPVTAAREVPAPTLWQRVRIALIRLWRELFAPEEAGTETG